WWRKGADRGDAASMQGIGYCYYFGEGVELDHRKAFEWVEKASELGHVGATHDLADYYRSGIGVEKDVPKAVELYVKAAGLGDSYAARELGYIYEGGWWGVARDKKEALKWYRVAVELGTTDAQRHLDRLGDEFHNETKFAEAVYWYRKGDDRGDAGCMHMIGLCYRYGNGVEKDMRKAFEWLEKASELGHVGATHDLAVYYENGTGVDKDEAKAIELHVNAAGLGNSISAQRLGHCYEDGECGVAVDKKEALKWCRVTVELGYTYAQ
ncbi:uncharacterized protein MICPUCDRAFT_10629, partial [Micromonas pusilla CCMP1545]